MLLAELNGKSCPAARDSEDYLTSAVFGHVRYVPPAVFWDDLLAHARGLPAQNGAESSLATVLAASDSLPSGYERLTAHFWRAHPHHGEPDLLLVFAACGRPPLVLLVEAKLWSGKSGSGEYDQLVRYLRALDDLAGLGLAVPADARRYLVYLTPRESLAEIVESANLADHPGVDRDRVFRLRWQDVLVTAGRAALTATGPAALILADVAGFLSRLGLEYFGGFRRLGNLPALTGRDGRFYYPDQSRARGAFAGFARVPGLQRIRVERGGWVR